MSKALLCPCEDVTLDDVEGALARGYRDVESIKRYTGFGTGICQGKSCLNSVAQVLARTEGVSPEAVLPFTPRPPLQPTELSVLATLKVDEAEVPTRGVPLSAGPPPAPGRVDRLLDPSDGPQDLGGTHGVVVAQRLVVDVVDVAGHGQAQGRREPEFVPVMAEGFFE